MWNIHHGFLVNMGFLIIWWQNSSPDMNPSEFLRSTSFSSIQPVQVTPSPAEDLPRPVLIHTYLYGRKVKISSDANGPFIYTPGYFEHSGFSGIEHPSIPLSTEVVEVKLPSTYADLTAKINQEAKGYEDINKKEHNMVAGCDPSCFYALGLGDWRNGFTVLNEGNCGRYQGRLRIGIGGTCWWLYTPRFLLRPQ